MLTTDLIIRPMLDSDLDEIMPIEHQAYPFPWKKSFFSECLQKNYYGCVLIHSKILGYAMMQLVMDQADIVNICINPAYQQQGLGKKLLLHLLEVAKQKAVKEVFLEVRISNQAAYRLYQSVGFNEISLRKNYYPARQGKEDAMVMGFRLN